MNRTGASLLALAFAFGADIAAQESRTAGSFRAETFAASHPENYLRYLQTTGKVTLYPWASRGFSRRELDRLIPRDTLHPWATRFAKRDSSTSRLNYQLIFPAATFRYNSAFAYGSNDGPIWAGRGLTSSVQAGVQGWWGPVTLTIAPVAFRSENQAFALLPQEGTPRSPYADPIFEGVDRPQRFGEDPYSQLDPGQTSVRLDLPYVSFGISTANLILGPGHELPAILGVNAAGFPHIFFGSSEPLDLWIAKLHGKAFWGELEQSDYSSVTGPERYLSRAEPGRKRFTTGVVLVIQPRGLTGLELGGTRFFHSIWPSSGIPRSYYTKFFQGFLKTGLSSNSPSDTRFEDRLDDRGIADNQLASVFARWAFLRSGFEIHAEYGRDDHSVDMRDLFQEPDHAKMYSFGARKVVSLTPSGLTGARVEIMNYQLPQLDRYRNGGEIYVHGLLRQGHTYKGQMLAADVGVGTGAGSVFAIDRFTPRGRWTASWSRVVRRERGQYVEAGVRTPRAMDVSHALAFEMSRFMRRFDITGALTGVYEMNRDFRDDATNLNAQIGVRYILN